MSDKKSVLPHTFQPKTQGLFETSRLQVEKYVKNQKLKIRT